MASYASLVSLQHVLEQILDLDDQHSSVHGAKQQMKSLHENIIFLVAFLDDFPEDAGDLLDQRIRKTANQAECIVERQISYEMHLENSWWPIVPRFISQLVLRVFPARRIAGGMELQLQDWQKELRGVMKEVESIVEEVTRIKSSSKKKDPILSDSPASTSGSLSSGLAPGDKDTMAFGLEQESLEIRGRLCGASSKLEVIPIIGMGGIGKTTLARYVYDDSLIAYHFTVRAWVTVSQNYHIKNILSTILYSVNPSNEEQYNTMSEDGLLLCLRQSLCGRTYLIVLDDVWDASAWEILRPAFPNDSNRSRIIITSRDRDVTSGINPSNLHQMKLLDSNDSWKLFKQKVFAQQHCPPKLEEIGMFIAKKCGGLPLTIVVIAGILSKDRMQKTWKRIAHDVNEAMNSSDGKPTDILYLSYKHLPQHLRPCFLYMGSFPEDYNIGASRLIKLWVAEGFLKLKRSKDPETVAMEYLEDLAKRSLILVVKKKSNGNIKTVKIHDHLRNLGLKIARKEKFLPEMKEISFIFRGKIFYEHRVSAESYVLNHLEGRNNSVLHTILPSFLYSVSYVLNHLVDCNYSIFHLVFHTILLSLLYSVSYVLNHLGGSNNSVLHSVLHTILRSFLYLVSYALNYLGDSNNSLLHTGLLSFPYSVCKPLKSFKLLRILDAYDVSFMYIPGEMGELFNLRYLCFRLESHMWNRDVLGFLPRLRNLETLVIMPFLRSRWDSSGFITPLLPHGIWRLTRLRHLIIFNVRLPDPSAEEFITLENIRTLSHVQHFKCSKRILKLVPNLKKLEIFYSYGFGTKWSEYMLKNLVHFQFLEELNFDVCPNSLPTSLQCYDIAFPQELKKLILCGCRIPWPDMTTIGSLSNLQVLKLIKNAFFGDNWETVEGEFCNLKVLLIDDSEPRQWVTESSHFPCLESLHLVNCSQLKEIPAGIGEIAALQLIELDYCKPHIEESAKCIEEEQRSFGNDELQVRILHQSSDASLYTSVRERMSEMFRGVM